MLEYGTVHDLLADPSVARVFDGHRWWESPSPGRLSVTPGLVDAGCGIGGYRENHLSPLLQAPRAILRLMAESGLAGVRVSSSTWAESAHFRTLACLSPPPRLALTGGGPVLTDSEPASDRERWVTSQVELDRAVAVADIERVGWVAVQTDQRDFAAACVTSAHRRGLRVALKAPLAAASSLTAGDLFVGVGGLLRRTAHDTATQLLLAWATDEVTSSLTLARDLGHCGVGFTSELLSLQRQVFVREALNAPFLEENVAILPHVRWLLQMRRGTGYIAGRSALRDYTGLSEPTRAEAKVAHAGWLRLLEAVANLDAAGVAIYAASTAPQMTQVPGFALKEELGVLLQAGVPLTRLLASATDPTPLGLEVSPDAHLLASTASPEDPVRLLSSLIPWHRTAVRQQHEGSGQVSSQAT